MKNNQELKQQLWATLRKSLPRILGQLDRDEDSPTFGSFDRNFWHYKIRDFSSMILQQGALILQTLHYWHIDGNDLYQNAIVRRWIQGAIRFWQSQQLRNGAFNEYYPYESGYPPTAFSLYTMGLLFADRRLGEPEPATKKAIQKAVNWTMYHREKQALNQETAGLAGIALAMKIPGICVDTNAFEKRLTLFFESQSEEGWFPEYGGPDIGYLSVTLDCLVDYYEATKDERATIACQRAVDFIEKWVTNSKATPIMINSRNTNYIVPYGLIRLGSKNPVAAAIVRKLFANTNDPRHYIHHIDDRYSCHYVFQSLFRGLRYLEAMQADSAVLSFERDCSYDLKHSGIYIQHRKGKGSVFISTRKGGVFYQYDTNRLCHADFGWRYKLKNQVACTHWHDERYAINVEQAEEIQVMIKGTMTVHGWLQPGPVEHALLRMTSFVFGNWLIPFLKKLMIFRKKPSNIHFERNIRVGKEYVLFKDAIFGTSFKPENLYVAPHTSMRHVASAGQYCEEELMIPTVRKIQREKTKVFAEWEIAFD